MITTMLAVMLLHVILGLPLFLSLMATAVVGFSFVGFDQMARIMPQQAFGGIDVFSLMAIPLFILAGNLMNNGQMTPRLLALADRLVGHLRGGLGHVNVTASVFFAWCEWFCGRRHLSAWHLAHSRYAQSGVSWHLCGGPDRCKLVDRPDRAAFDFHDPLRQSDRDICRQPVSGGCSARNCPWLGFHGNERCLCTHLQRRKNQRRANFREMACAAYNALPALIAPVIIVAGIVLGVVTPTESGALTVAYVLIWGLWTKNLSIRDAWLSLRETAILTSASLSSSRYRRSCPGNWPMPTPPRPL